MKRLPKATSTGALALVTAIVLTMSACGGAAPQSSDSPSASAIESTPSGPSPMASSPAQSPSDSSPNQSPSASSPTSAAAISALDAINIAVQRTPGIVVEVETENYQGSRVWEVIVRASDDSGSKLYIDRASGNIVDEKAKRLSDEDLETPAISATEAITKIQQVVPGTLTDLELETEHSALIWEAKVRSDSGARIEVHVDAMTGEILSQNVDD